MAVTRSWAVESVLTAEGLKPPVPAERKRELFWLIGASAFILAGLFFVISAKTQDVRVAAAHLRDQTFLNLNAVTEEDQLVPHLQMVPDAERQQAAEATFEFLQRHRPLANVGSLARVRLGAGKSRSVLPMSRMKPLLVVRTPNEFLRIA